MFLTLTSHPCLERTLQLPDLISGTAHRVASHEVKVSLGGKGLNAARVAARFGAQVHAIAPIGHRQIAFCAELARQNAIRADFLAIEAEMRWCLNLVHEGGGSTEIIEDSAPLSVSCGTGLLDKWRENLPYAQLALIGGSYPPSTNPAFELHAALLCQMAAQAGVPLIYDGYGVAFQRALRSQAPPWAIKPNLHEAELLLGRAIAAPTDERRAVRDLHSLGAKIVFLSCGSRGLYVGHPSGIEWLEAPRVEAVSSVGCGDTFVGAFAARWLESTDLSPTRRLLDAARWGVAAASASAAQLLPAHVWPDEAAQLLPQVRPQTLEISLSSG